MLPMWQLYVRQISHLSHNVAFDAKCCKHACDAMHATQYSILTYLVNVCCKMSKSNKRMKK